MHRAAALAAPQWVGITMVWMSVIRDRVDIALAAVNKTTTITVWMSMVRARADIVLAAMDKITTIMGMDTTK